eukprot:scaffold3498_cov17-Tisochrysis_lutea.AAC.1
MPTPLHSLPHAFQVYASMLLGFIIQDCPSTRGLAATLLPGGTLKPLVSAIQRCLAFYVSAGAITDVRDAPPAGSAMCPREEHQHQRVACLQLYSEEQLCPEACQLAAPAIPPGFYPLEVRASCSAVRALSLELPSGHLLTKVALLPIQAPEICASRFYVVNAPTVAVASTTT